MRRLRGIAVARRCFMRSARSAVFAAACAIALVALAGDASAQRLGASAGRSPLVANQPAGLTSGPSAWSPATRGGPAPRAPAPSVVAPLPVPLINQNDPADGGALPNGCEATSLTMVLRYAGANVGKGTVFGKIPRSTDPNAGFNGMGVYHSPIAATGQQIINEQHLPVHIVDYTGKSLDEVLESTVGRGRPVQIVTNATYRPLPYKVDLTRVPPDEHSVVIVGYDQNTVTIRDPLLARNNSYPNSNGTVTLPRSTFEAAWQQMGSQAIGYEPN